MQSLTNANLVKLATFDLRANGKRVKGKMIAVALNGFFEGLTIEVL